jgi:long-chain acyl-CoA synthetase
MKAFLHHAKTQPDKNFLGTRQKLPGGGFGGYQWLTYGQVASNVEKLARVMMKLDFCPEMQAENKAWRFCGIWARNRQEWLTTELAMMHFNITNVGFYEAMGINAADYIIN